MQTVPPSACFAKFAESATLGMSNTNNAIGYSLSFPVMGQAGASVICRGRHITNLRFACQLSRFASAVRFSSRSEMLASRAKLVHCSRFAPAAQPQVSSSRAAPRRSVSIARSAQAEATTRIHGRSRSARIANTLVAVFNRAMSPQATAKTRCLTIRSTGHFVASGCWASFHSRPTAGCHKMPVSSNVRQHRLTPRGSVTQIQYKWHSTTENDHATSRH